MTGTPAPIPTAALGSLAGPAGLPPLRLPAEAFPCLFLCGSMSSFFHLGYISYELSYFITWAREAREARAWDTGHGDPPAMQEMNTEFQRIARRDKKVFLSDQCKEIEESNRMEKTRDHFKKI